MGTDVEDWRGQVPRVPESGQLIGIDTGTDEALPDESPMDRIAQLLGASRDDERAEVKLYRIRAGKMAWCGDYRPGVFEDGGFEMIRREFGPGEYHVRLYGPGPSGRFVVRAKQDLTIEARASDADRPPAPGHALHGIDRVLEAMQAQNAAMMRAITERPVSDPAAQMKETLTLMSLMKEVLGGGNGGGAMGISDMLKAMRELKEAGKEFAPSEKEDSEPSLLGMLPQVLDLVKSAAANQAQVTAPVPMIALPPAVAGATQAAPLPDHSGAVSEAAALALLQQRQHESASAQEDDPLNAYQMMKLRTLLSTVVAMAAKNAPIETAADLLLQELPEELLDIMEGDEWFSALSQAAPILGVDITSHREWLTRVREHMLTEEDEPPQAKV